MAIIELLSTRASNETARLYTFSEILSKIGNRDRLGPDKKQLIEAPFRTKELFNENFPSAIRLFHWNHNVDAYSNIAIVPQFESIADDKVLDYRNRTEIVVGRRKLHKMNVVEAGGLPYSFKLAVGYPYVITTNLDVQDGLVSGAILEHVERLTEDEQDAVEEGDHTQQLKDATTTNRLHQLA